MQQPEIIRPVGADVMEAVDEIVALVAQLEAAQQAEDVAGFTELFADDVVWTTAHGKRIAGRDAIHAFTETVLPGAMRESTAGYDVERIAFLRSDVAVVSVRQRPVTHAGAPLEGTPEGRPTYVVARDGDRWLIAAGQNTQVKEGRS